MASGVELATAYVTLTVSTRGMGKDVAREFSGVEKSADASGKRAGTRFTGGLKSGIAKAGGVLAGVFAAQAGFDFFKDAVSGASDLEQSVGGVEAVFGKYAKNVKKASKSADRDLGLSANTYNELVTVSGALLKNKGLKDFASQSENLVTVGADLSAQFGGSTKDAVDALNAAMRGESDPIERYGISLNETAVNAELAAKGQDKLKGKALEQAKTQARLAIIQRQSADAQGAFARESDTTAGKQQRLSAVFENLKATLGEKLLPVISTVTDFFLNDLGPAAGKVIKFVQPVLDVLGKIPEAFQAGFSGDISSFDGFLGVIATIGDFVGVLYDNFKIYLPIALDIAKRAFTVVSDFIKIQVIPRVMGIVDAIKGFVDVALPIVRAFVKGMIDRITPMMPTIRDIFKTIGDIITGALDLIKAIIERVTAVISWIWTNWGNGIMDFIALVWEKILGIIGPAFDGIKALFATFTAVFKGDWKGAWEGLKTVFGSAWKIVKGAIDLALTLLGKALSIAWEAIKTKAGEVWGGIATVIGNAWTDAEMFTRGSIDRILQFIQENLIDKVNGLFSFLKIPLYIQPIWKQSNVGKGMVNAGRLGTDRKLGARGGSTRNERGMGGALPSSGSGGLSRPVSQPVGTGWNGYPGHKGVDFLTPIGTPVRSLLSGTVVDDGWDAGGFGNHIRTRDADGNMTIFGHLTRDVVSVGQKIAKGQVIGYSGNTGNSTGPHLHVERRVPPFGSSSAYNWLSGAGAPSGNFNPIADLLRNGISTIASGARGFASQVGGPFGPLFANILERLVKGVGARGLSLLGIEGGELRPRLYDQGGMIPPGDTLVRNLTGRPEMLLPPGAGGGLTRGDLDRLVAALERANMSATISVGAVDRALAGRL